MTETFIYSFPAQLSNHPSSLSSSLSSSLPFLLSLPPFLFPTAPFATAPISSLSIHTYPILFLILPTFPTSLSFLPSFFFIHLMSPFLFYDSYILSIIFSPYTLFIPSSRHFIPVLLFLLFLLPTLPCSTSLLPLSSLQTNMRFYCTYITLKMDNVAGPISADNSININWKDHSLLGPTFHNSSLFSDYQEWNGPAV